MRLQNKVAAITGAGRGIGRAAAEIFAREGAAIAILEVNQALGEETREAITQAGGKAVLFPTDVQDIENVRSTFNSIQETFGALHILYNNASVYLGMEDADVAALSLPVWDKITGINLNGLFYCSKCAIPLMVQSGGGSIINTASSAGLIGIPRCDAYTASKGATISLTRSMAVEYGKMNIRVNCIAPAGIYTPMVYESNINNPAFDYEHFQKVTPMGRWGTAGEVANVALFLASDEASFVNGAVIVTDGGITITNCY